VFPVRGELETLSAESLRPKSSVDALDVERWDLPTPPSDSAPGSEPAGFWEHALQERFPDAQEGGPRVRSAPELHCAAREMARFYVQNGSYPGEGLREFLALRCGSTLAKVRFATMHSTIPAQVPETTVEEQLGPSVQELLARVSVDDGTEIGIGYARGHLRGAIVVLSGTVRARLSAFSPIVTGNGITLRGELSSNAPWLLAIANQGPLGAVACEGDRSVALPKFQVFCPFSDKDRSARIEIVVNQEKRVMFDTVAQTLIRRSETDAISYRPVVYGVDEVAPDSRAFRDSLYASLNQARVAAGLRPLAIEAQQASLNERLSPRLFDSLARGDLALADRIALGLLAGWDVGGVIRNGAFFAGTLAGERRAARFLAAQLERPLARFLLLDGSLSQIAVGATELDPTGAGAVITGYSLFQESDRERDQAQLLNELTKARAAQNKPRPRFLPPSAALRAALTRVEKEQVSAFAALEDTLADSEGSEPLRGWALETHDFRQIPWPDELLLPSRLEVEVGLVHYKPKTGAWGQFAVVFVIHKSVMEARALPQGRASERG
jgi:hypothetical protein